jgi:DNA-binding GntR family transcriptional regulator
MTAEVRTLAEAVQTRLSSDILAGRFVPGSKLRLAALTRGYDVGMSPLREALARLVGQGLVIQEGQRGFRVSPVSAVELSDLTATRRILETTALSLAIGRGGPEWEAEVLGAHHRLARHPRSRDKLVDEEWEALHRAFHLSLIGACGLPTLLSFCGNLYDHIDRYRRLAVRAAGRHPAIPDIHKRLTEAVLKKEADLAVRLLTGHIQHAEEQILALGEGRLFPTPAAESKMARILQRQEAFERSD